MKKSKLFIYLLTPLILLGLTSCLGRGHNLRKISSVEIVDEDNIIDEVSIMEQQFVDGVKSVTIGNYFDISNLRSQDDSDGFIQEGNWFQDNLKGSNGSISRYTSDPSARAIYSTDKLGDSTYCIWVYRVTSEDATKNLIVDVYDGAEQIGLGSIDLSLPKSRKGWFPFGEYTFTNGQESRVILSKGFEDQNILRVDEVRFDRLEENYDCYGQVFAQLDDERVVHAKEINNTTFKGTEGYREYGTWVNSNLKGEGGQNARVSDDEYAYAVYNFMPSNDSYCLDLFRVTKIGALSNVRVSVFQEDTEILSTLVSFNLNPSKSGWVKLGKQNVEKDKMLSVIIERDPQDIGILITDAVKLYSSQNCD